MIRQKGFTLLEISVAIAMVGVLATIAVPVYQGHITKTQVTEAFSFMEANKVKVADSMLRTGKCEIDGATTVQGKNGVLIVSGTVVPEAMAFPKHTLKTGCVLTYKFNNAGVTKHIAGKTVVADLVNNSVLSRSASTNVNDKFLPRVFAVAALDTAPTLAAIPAAPELPKLEVIPSTPPTPSTPSGETVVAVDTKPDGIVCKDTYEKKSDETVITLGSAGHYKREAAYYVRGSINLYDIFMNEVKRAPVAGEKIKFVTTCAVAFVGNATNEPRSATHLVPAITVGGFGSDVDIEFINFGAVLGRGGYGGHILYGNRLDGPHTTAPIRGGTAIKGGQPALKVQNYGVIAGGGGGGAWNVWLAGGGGAPYGGFGAIFRSAEFDKSISPYNSNAPIAKGGKWGEPGETLYIKENTPFFRGAPAGYIKEGNVVITNHGSGKSLGN